MPDKSGNKTIRDAFPIYCSQCNGLIEPTKWDDGELLADGQKYRIIDIRNVGGSWVSIYSHRDCGITQMPSVDRPKFTYDAPSTCLYCATECEGRFCSDRCKALHEKEIADRVPSVATSELMDRLREIRERQERDPHPGAGKRGTGAPLPVRDLSSIQPEKLPHFVPQNELGVVFMFGGVIDKLGYRMAMIDGRYPDAVVVSPDNNTVKIEFEFESSNFVTHKHDPDLCDLVVCWTRDRHLPLPTIALSNFYNAETGRWNFAELV